MAAKKSTKKTKVDDTSIESTPDVSYASMNTPVSPRPRGSSMKWVIIAAILIAAGVYGFRNYRGQIVVATIDGKPVLRSELNSRLSSQFGKQVLEIIIGEQLIFNEATKKNVTVSDDEVTAKMAEVEKSLGGQMTLDQSLELQGVTKDEFISRVKIQLMIEKLFASEASASAEEVATYLKDNAAMLTATVEAEKKIEAETAIKQNKINQKFFEWFNGVKETAKIERYL